MKIVNTILDIWLNKYISLFSLYMVSVIVIIGLIISVSPKINEVILKHIVDFFTLESTYYLQLYFLIILFTKCIRIVCKVEVLIILKTRSCCPLLAKVVPVLPWKCSLYKSPKWPSERLEGMTSTLPTENREQG